MVFERTFVDAATACARVDGDGQAESGNIHDTVWDAASVATHAVRGAVEDGHATWVFPVKGPVPVGLCAGVTAFVTQSLFVEPEVVAVEVEKEALHMIMVNERKCQVTTCITYVEMNIVCLLDMQGGKIIEVAPCTGDFGFWVDWRLFHHALDGADIFFTALLGHGAPVLQSVPDLIPGWPPRCRYRQIPYHSRR